MAEARKIVIVGGVAGGASAAARARRLDETAEIIMFERGEHISFANCGLPYHIGGTITDRARLLVQTPEAMTARFRIDVRVRTEVTAIDRPSKQVIAISLETGEESRQRYDALILSPGAEPVRPPIPGVDSPRVRTLRNIADMDAIKRIVDEDRPERAVVVGGGYIGLEMAEVLRQRGLEVTLIEMLEQVMGPADPEMASLLHQELRQHGVDLRLGTSVTALSDDDGSTTVTLSDDDKVRCGLVVLAVGVRPEAKLAREAGLALGTLGGVLVNDRMQTSDPDIYAVGDAVEVEDFVTADRSLIPLAGPANRQGRIAADNILGRESRYKRTQGTAICKVFNLAIGMTGLSEKAATAKKLDCEKVYVHPPSHADYYPGASPITLKVLFDPGDGSLLGAQAVGADGVDKRIDVLAMAIRFGLTVYDLEDVELSYAPPYGSAKDPVNYAGFTAANALRGDVALCHTDDVTKAGDEQVVLDVRMASELEAGMIPGAKHIPLDQLRERLGELPKNHEVLAYCQVGLRGYLACRILAQHGYSCRNLTGGYKTYVMSTGGAQAASRCTPQPSVPTR